MPTGAAISTCLAEKEATKAIQLLQRMSRHLGIEGKTLDPEVRELRRIQQSKGSPASCATISTRRPDV